MSVPIEPGWLSLLPPLAAIGLALLFREVVISLFAGIWLGALLLSQYNPIAATLTTVDRFAVGALADEDHIAIIVFSLMLGGMVGVMNRNGGTRGIVEALRGLATTQRRGQFLTWLAGIIIFFDDYANTLIVGNTMRPVTDRLKVSREKLSYIVDSTAAPMAAIAVVSTWVGFEITLIGDALKSAAAQATDAAVRADLLAAAENPFNVFLHSIPYLFYPILALIFVLLIVITGRDFGPMLKAENRASAGGGLLRPGAMPAADTSGGIMEPPDGVEHRWYNAAIPVLSVIVVALVGIFYTGAQSLGAGDHSIREIVGAADPFDSLIWASLTGSIVAIGLTVAQRIVTAQQAIEAWVGGLKAMMLAMVILVLAWSLGDVTEALGTGPYLSALLQDSLPIQLLPVLVFLVAALISFATGTSWGTMAILFPVVVPLAVAMGAGIGFGSGDDYTILLGVVSSVMAGSIFGDHCSPISDTTVMSSMASACDHVDHVRTQLPYAVTVALVGMALGDVPTALGLNPFVALVLGIAVLYGILRVFGKPSVDPGYRPVEAVEPAPAVAPAD
ncbi:MAG TPA: Na+/H+ antiporter NhaC family protein [Longimicrobiales bacterium]